MANPKNTKIISPFSFFNCSDYLPYFDVSKFYSYRYTGVWYVANEKAGSALVTRNSRGGSRVRCDVIVVSNLKMFNIAIVIVLLDDCFYSPVAK